MWWSFRVGLSCWTLDQAHHRVLRIEVTRSKSHGMFVILMSCHWQRRGGGCHDAEYILIWTPIVQFIWVQRTSWSFWWISPLPARCEVGSRIRLKSFFDLLLPIVLWIPYRRTLFILTVNCNSCLFFWFLEFLWVPALRESSTVVKLKVYPCFAYAVNHQEWT